MPAGSPETVVRRPRVAPSTVAMALGAVALLGASFVYVQGRRILEGDQRVVAAATPAYLAHFLRVEADLERVEAEPPGSATFRVALEALERESRAVVWDAGPRSSILDPLRRRSDALNEEIRALAAAVRSEATARAIAERVAAVRGALADARGEALELRCHARIECASSPPG